MCVHLDFKNDMFLEVGEYIVETQVFESITMHKTKQPWK